MGNNQTEKAFEEKRLAQTISLAEEQLKQAKEAADKKKSEIIEAKKDVRENTEHGITSLYTSDGFEALVELSQYINPVTDKIIDYEEEEHKILLLEKMIKSPYFARIDFKFDDNLICSKYIFDAKAYLPISLIVSGILTSNKFLPSKASLAIFVTFLFSIISGIVTLCSLPMYSLIRIPLASTSYRYSFLKSKLSSFNIYLTLPLI